MNVYLYNPGKATQHFGVRAFAGQKWSVVTEEEAKSIAASGMEVFLESDPRYKPLFVVNFPDRQVSIRTLP